MRKILKKTKAVLALVLCFAMVAGMLPSTALASDPDTNYYDVTLTETTSLEDGYYVITDGDGSPMSCESGTTEGSLENRSDEQVSGAGAANVSEKYIWKHFKSALIPYTDASVSLSFTDDENSLSLSSDSYTALDYVPSIGLYASSHVSGDSSIDPKTNKHLGAVGSTFTNIDYADDSIKLYKVTMPTSGTIGSCAWSINEGTLTIGAGDLPNGNGDTKEINWPWYLNTSIKKVVIEEGVNPGDSLYGIFCGLTKLESIEGLTNLNTASVTNMSCMFYNCAKLAPLDVTSFNTASVTDMSYMFYKCSSLKALDVTGFNTSKVTDMGYMFSACSGLESIDVSKFDTTNVTDTTKMFQSCSNLATLDLSNFNTSKVTNMLKMFDGCSALTTIYAGSGWSTASLAKVYNMFGGCTSLKGGAGTTCDGTNNIDATYARIDGGTTNESPGYLTYKAPALKDVTLKLCTSMNTSLNGVYYVITDKDGHPMSCEAGSTAGTLVAGEEIIDANTTSINSDYVWRLVISLSQYNNPDLKLNLDDSPSSLTFSNEYSSILPSYDNKEFTIYSKTSRDGTETNINTYKYIGVSDGVFTNLSTADTTLKIYAVTINSGVCGTCPWSIDENGTLTIKAGTLPNGAGSEKEISWPWIYNTKIKKVVIEEGVVTGDSLNQMFYGLSGVTSIEGLSNLDTAKVTDMSSMFYNCRILTELDVTKFDTSKVTNMNSMFYSCNSLTELDVTNFDTSKVTNMSSMFLSCRMLTELDVTKFDTAKVTNMSSMFNSCNALTELDVTKFDTSEVTNMSSMFYSCKALEELDVTKFDTSKVTNMWNMFYSCKALEELDVTNFDTSNVTNMSSMFCGCNALDEIDLTKFDTSNVTNMSSMFSGCKTLTELDLSSFDTAKVTKMASMFKNCSELTTIYVGSGWTTTGIEDITTNGKQVFTSCAKLVGGAGTTCDGTNNINATYARIDGGTTSETPGYLTYKAPALKDVTLKLCSALSTINAYYVITDKDGHPMSCEAGSTAGTLVAGEEIIDANTTSINSDYVWRNVVSLSQYNNPDLKLNLDDSPSSLSFSNEYSSILPSYRNKEFTIYSKISRDGTTTNINTYKYIGVSDGVFTNLSTADTTLKIYTVTINSGVCGTCPWSIDENGTLTIKAGTLPNGAGSEKEISWPWICNIEIKKVVIEEGVVAGDSLKQMFYGLTGVTSIEGLSNLDTSNVTNMSNMFAKVKVKSIEGISSLDTTNVTDMSDMFNNCTLLTTLDLSNFDTSKVTNMSNMFSHCTALTKINLSSFDTANVTNMNSMFYACKALEEIDVTKFNTANVTDMSSMFAWCSVLEELDVTKFDTSNVTDMSTMFGYCNALKEFDLSNFNTSKVTNMSSMFDSCKALKELDLSNFNTSKVTNMSSMFDSCDALEELDVTKFDTSNVTKMATMFSSCKALKELDLSSFDTPKVTKMSSMFNNCTELTTIYVGSGWTTAGIEDIVKNGKDIFKSCTSLKGGAGTTCDGTNNINATYARIDGGTTSETPGYLTGKYTVTFDANGGTGDMDAQTFTQGVETKLSANAFTLSGYNFLGWSETKTDETATYIDEAEITVNKDTTLYAIWKAIPTDINVTENPASDLTFNGEAQALGTVTPDLEGCTISYKVGAGDYSTNAPTAKDADTYTVSYKVEKDGYDTVESSFEVTISKAELSIEGTAADGKVYDGTTTAGNINIGTLVGKIAGTDVNVSVEGTFDSKDVGNGKDVKLTYTLTGSDNDNYVLADKNINETTVADIEKRQVTITTESATKAYDGTPLTNANVTIGGGGFVEGEVTVTATGSQTEAGESDNTVECKWGKDFSSNNYTVTECLGKLTVSPKAVTVTANDASKKYGDNDPELTATVEGTIGTDKITYTVTRAAGEAVNTYAITPAGDATQGNYTVNYVPGTFTISNASISYTLDDSYSGKYDGAEHSVGVTVTEPATGATISYSIDDGATWTSGSSYSAKNAGDYSVKFKIEAEGYTDVITDARTIAIAKRPVTLTSTSDSKKYDGSALSGGDVAVTGDGFVAGEATATASTLTKAGSTVNLITINEGTGYDANNYSITKFEGTLEVTKRSVTVTTEGGSKYYDGTPLTNSTVTVSGDGFVAGEVTVTASGSQTEVGESDNTAKYKWAVGFSIDNYDVTENLGKLTVIEKKDASASDFDFTAPSEPTYDGKAKEATVAAKGSVTGMGEITVKYFDLEGAELANAPTNVGTYTVKIDLAEGDCYKSASELTDATWTFTIAKAKVDVPQAKTGLIYNGKIQTGVETPAEAKFTLSNNTAMLADDYTATAVLADKDNYEWNLATPTSDDQTIAWSIGKITTPIIITADSDEKAYDGKALTKATFTYTDGVVVSGDVLSAEVSGTITDVGTVANKVTSYEIMNGTTDVTSCYTFGDTVNGTLEVTKRGVTLTSASDSKKYDGQALTNDTVTVTGDGFIDGEGATYTVTGTQTDAGKSANTFSYTLNQGTKADNYEIQTVEGELEVTARKVTLTSTSDSKKYDGQVLTNAEVTVSGDGFIDGEGATYTVTGSALDAGTYDNEFTYELNQGTKAENYEITPVYGTLEIIPRDIKFVSASDSKQYDAKALTNSKVVVYEDGFAPDEGASYTVTGTRTAVGSSDNVFEYKLDEGTKAINYNVTTIYGVLTVAKNLDEITIAVKSATKEYDGEALDGAEVGYEVTGNIMEGDTLEVVIESTITDAGEIANEVASYKVTNEAGEDVTGFYTFADVVSGTLKVEESDDIALTVPSSNTWYYSDKVHSGKATANIDGTLIEYSVNGGDWTEEAPKFNLPGTYNVSVRASKTNYITKTAEFTFAIKKAPKTAGFAKDHGVWGYYKDGKLTTVTGYFTDEDRYKSEGVTYRYHVVNGLVDFNLTKIVKDGNSRYYKNGRWQCYKTGAVKIDGVYYYVTNGVLDTKFAGIAKIDGQWRYFAKGVWQKSYSGFVTYKTSKTYTWRYRIDKGVINWKYAGIAKADGNKYYKDGRWKCAKTGCVKIGSGYYYVTKGVLNAKFTGLAKADGQWRYFKNGVWQKNYSGFVTYKTSKTYTWRYRIDKGVINWKYTGIADNGRYYLDGRWKCSYNHSVKVAGKTYKLVNGYVKK